MKIMKKILACMLCGEPVKYEKKNDSWQCVNPRCPIGNKDHKMRIVEAK